MFLKLVHRAAYSAYTVLHKAGNALDGYVVSVGQSKHCGKHILALSRHLRLVEQAVVGYDHILPFVFNANNLVV